MQTLTRHASCDECHWPRLVHAKIISSNETKVLMVCLLCELLKSWILCRRNLIPDHLPDSQTYKLHTGDQREARPISPKETSLHWNKISFKMNRSLSYTPCTFKIFESNAFPIKNHFSLYIYVSDMEVEENICKWNIFVSKILDFQNIIPRIKIASIRPSNTSEASTFCWWQLPTKSLNIKIEIVIVCVLFSHLKNAAL